MSEKKFVYADNAATTRVSPAAFSAMKPYLTDICGNPSSIYAYAREAARVVIAARAGIAKCFGAAPEEIFFTSGGTESDNWAIKGAAELRKNKGRHIITTAVEHHAVLHSCKTLEGRAFEVTYLPVDRFGIVSPEALRKALRPDTILVSVMSANNEIGTVMPLREIGEITRERGILFHCDAVQSAGHLPLNPSELNIDLMSVSAHKFRGPKGAGLLYMRKGLRLPPLMDGGGHERGLRSGTENVPGIVGMAAALSEAVENMQANTAKVMALRDRLIEGVLKIPYACLTGHPELRLPGTASFVIDCIEGESMVLMLDAFGICASSGSACSSGSLDPSHVLLAVGLPHETAHGSLRLTLNEDNTDEDVDYIIDKLPGIVDRLRAMSPLWELRQKNGDEFRCTAKR